MRLTVLPLLVLLSACGGGKKRAKPSQVLTAERMKTELAAQNLEFGAPVFIRAFKEERELEFFVKSEETGKFELFRRYYIAGISGVLGPKLAEGDGQVPEGFYHVPPSAMNPNSRFHLAFNIGFPNTYDKAHDRTGSFIMVHGSNVSVGCLAMTDEKIEEIYETCQAAHQGGQDYFRIHIFPFRMTQERMEKAAESEHLPFWQNLKTGYDFFENQQVPPNVLVKNKKYAFE